MSSLLLGHTNDKNLPGTVSQLSGQVLNTTKLCIRSTNRKRLRFKANKLTLLGPGLKNHTIELKLYMERCPPLVPARGFQTMYNLTNKQFTNEER